MTKILKLNPQVVFTLSKFDLYSEARNLLLHGLEIVPSPNNIIIEMNITPAMFDVPVHYGEDPINSTA
jgi:hypothetical protein